MAVRTPLRAVAVALTAVLTGGLPGAPAQAAPAGPAFSPPVRLADDADTVTYFDSVPGGRTSRGGEVVHTWFADRGDRGCLRLVSTIGPTRGRDVRRGCLPVRVEVDGVTNVAPFIVDAAVDATGRAVVAYAYVRQIAEEGGYREQVVLRTVERASTDAPWSAGTTRTVTAGSDIASLDVDLGPRGRAVVGWARARVGDGTVLEAVRRGADGEWGPRQRIDQTSSVNVTMDVAWPTDGRPVAAFDLYDRQLDSRSRIGLAVATEQGWRVERRLPVRGPDATLSADGSPRLRESAGSVLATWTTEARSPARRGPAGWQAAVRGPRGTWTSATPGGRAYVPARSFRVERTRRGFVTGSSTETTVSTARFDARTARWRTTPVLDGQDPVRVRTVGVDPEGRTTVGWARYVGDDRVVEVATQRRPGADAVRITAISRSPQVLVDLTLGADGYALAVLHDLGESVQVQRRTRADGPWRPVRGVPRDRATSVVDVVGRPRGTTLVWTGTGIDASWLPR